MLRPRHFLSACVATFCFASADIPAPPAIEPEGIINSASGLPPALRGGAIARGTLITIPGVRMGPKTAVRGSESDPPITLSDVSVRVHAKQSSTDLGLLSVSATRIDAWIPDAAPLGKVSLTVRYLGRTSEPYELTIVRSSPAFFAHDPVPAGAPGGTLALRTSGLHEKTLEIFVGGRPARAVQVAPEESCCRGVQRVSFELPVDSPHGCFVPVQARSAESGASNVVPVAVHAPGEACHDDVDWFRESVEQASRAGFLVLSRVSIVPGQLARDNDFQFDYGLASFGRQETGQRPFPPLPPSNTCTVFASRVNLRQIVRQSRTPAEWTSIPDKTPGNRRLDSGPALTVTGPGGTRELGRDQRQRDYYNVILGGHIPFSHDPAVPLFLDPGAYTVTSRGGADVGPFATTLDIPGELLWTNRSKLTAVSRSAGVTVEWKAARANDAVVIMATNSDPRSGDAAVCLCMAPARQGHFTIPPLSLDSVPPTPADSDWVGSYLVLMEIPVAPPARIHAQGLDAAFAASISVTARRVKYR